MILAIGALALPELPAVVAREDEPQVRAFATMNDSLTVMTYNIHSGRNLDGVRDLAGIHEVMDSSGAHVVGLQEVERWTVRSGFTDQVRYLASRGAWRYRYGPTIVLPPGVYGNALLSEHPIRESVNVRLPSPRETRGFLRTVIEMAPGQPVAVYVTHLGLNQNEREEHVTRLLTSIRGEDMPVVLMGDFNAMDDSSEIQALQAELQDAGAAQEAQPTFPAGAPVHRIDYIFVSPHFSVEEVRVIDSQASDHQPVVARLRLVH